MRLLIWILGVMVTLAGLMEARAVAPGWVWVWWTWLGVCGAAGVVVLAVALARAAAGGQRPAPWRPQQPRPDAAGKPQGGE